MSEEYQASPGFEGSLARVDKGTVENQRDTGAHRGTEINVPNYPNSRDTTSEGGYGGDAFSNDQQRGRDENLPPTTSIRGKSEELGASAGEYLPDDVDGLDIKTNDKVARSGPALREAPYGGKERGPAINENSDVGA